MKRCPSCRRELPFAAFSRQADKAMGLRVNCKQCIAAKRRSIVARPKNTPPSLTCGLCGKIKAFHRFAVDLGKNSGRKSYCLDCQKAREKKRLTASCAAAVAKIEANQRWRERNPQKAAAHTKLWNSLQGRKIFKEPCVRCGSTKVQAHHEDYSKPLEVIWLCSACHMDYHTGRWRPGPDPEQMRREREAAAVA